MYMLHKVEEAMRKKKSLYYELKCEWEMHSADHLVKCLGDFNGYVGRHIDGVDGVHEGHGVGQRNLEGRMLLVLSGERSMCVKYKAQERRRRR